MVHLAVKMVDLSLTHRTEEEFRDMVYFPRSIDLLISVFLSAIATGVVVLLSLIFKLYKKPLSRMVLAINVAHVFFYYSKLSVLVFPPQTTFHCRILAITVVFGMESAAIWGALFAHSFYITLKYQSTLEILRMMKFYVLLAVVVPLISGIVSFSTNFFIYAEKEGTCVHRVYSDRIDIQYDVFVITPIWLACVVGIIWYKMAINKIARLQESQVGAEVYVLLIYPGILLFCWSPLMTTQTAMGFGATPGRMLVEVCIFLANMQGFCDALVYGRSVREALRDSINGWLGRTVSKEEQTFIEPQCVPEKLEKELANGNYSLLSAQSDLVISRKTVESNS